jgi:hypothetical protein
MVSNISIYNTDTKNGAGQEFTSIINSLFIGNQLINKENERKYPSKLVLPHKLI